MGTKAGRFVGFLLASLSSLIAGTAAVFADEFKTPAIATVRVDWRAALGQLRTDGGMVANDWFCQRLADLTGLKVERPRVTETTALGAAYLAGLGARLFRNEKDIAARWVLDRRFVPSMKKTERDRLYRGWLAAISRVR